MGTSKKYIIISGFDIHDNNRGSAALGYGSIAFLYERGYLIKGQSLVNFRIYKNPLKKINRTNINETVKSGDIIWTHYVICVSILEVFLLKSLGIFLPFSKFRRIIKNTELVAAINGGDGFSDIYNTPTFLGRLPETRIAMSAGLPLIILPQTLGPFKDEQNKRIAMRILKYAANVFVRDERYNEELKRQNIEFELTKDLSYYMKPEPWSINLAINAIGINVSGLAYSNRFRALAGQFTLYPKLIQQLIEHFREKGYIVYLIPHSYNYFHPATDNDDIIACRKAYESLENKGNVFIIDKNLTSPQLKYVISKMSLFIGTRMHANFAAIYTGVPVFGLAYSYKFRGAFDANGLDGGNQTAMINNISESDIKSVISKIDRFWNAIK